MHKLTAARVCVRLAEWRYEKDTMLMIRLARFGAKKKPTYRLVVIDKERARDSRALEVVGHYNPVAKPKVVHLDQARIDYWLGKGARASDTVTRLIKYSAAAVPPVASQPVA